MDSFSLLFVDDEVDFLSTIKEFFSDLGYLIHTAQNGQEALIRLKEHRPKAVFLDISMPHMDGTETLQLIKEYRSRRYSCGYFGVCHRKLSPFSFKSWGLRFLPKTCRSNAVTRYSRTATYPGRTDIGHR
jgi:two-component SAPR family response regulator